MAVMFGSGGFHFLSSHPNTLLPFPFSCVSTDLVICNLKHEICVNALTFFK